MKKNQFDPSAQPETVAPQPAHFDGNFTGKQQAVPQGRQLTVEEERKKQDAFALQEMMKTAGWSIVNDILQAMPKGHIDPRGMTQEDWLFAELNAFHAGNVASELLAGLHTIIREGQTLQQIELGEIQETRKMRI